MKKELLNPKGYLSWSQVSLWMRSPEKYVQQYMYGAEGVHTNRMAFGSKAAAALENGEKSDDDLINMLVALLPRYQKAEFELRTPFKTDNGTIHLLGKMDTFDPKTPRFREYKTGVNPWTQNKAEKHMQLDHYAAMIWLKYKKMPTEIWLDWAETEDTDGEVNLTGKIESFLVKKTTSDVLRYLAIVSKVAQDIDKRYRLEMNQTL